MNDKPSLGRVVLFRNGHTNGQEFPAMITEVFDELTVSLKVFSFDVVDENQFAVKHNDNMTDKFSAGWRWPPRV